MIPVSVILTTRNEAANIERTLETIARGALKLVLALKCFHDFVHEGRTGRVFDHISSGPEATLAVAPDGSMADPEHALSISKHGSEAARRCGYNQIAEVYLEDFAHLLKGRAPDA